MLWNTWIGQWRLISAAAVWVMQQTWRQHLLCSKRSLSHLCVMLVRWLQKGTRVKAHLSVSHFLCWLVMWRAVCLRMCCRKCTLHRPSGWMGVWWAEITCEVSQCGPPRRLSRSGSTPAGEQTHLRLWVLLLILSQIYKRPGLLACLIQRWEIFFSQQK